jgi:hypothetical protein
MTDWPARLALDLLNAAEDCYDRPGSPTCPPRRGVIFGTLPALDCPMLAVTLVSVEARAGVGTPSNRCTAVPRARLAVWVARCYPTMDDSGNPPSITAEEQASCLLDADLGVLWDGLIGRWATGDLFPSFPGLACEAVTFGVSAAQGPSGGLASWSLPVTVDLVGIR